LFNYREDVLGSPKKRAGEKEMVRKKEIRRSGSVANQVQPKGGDKALSRGKEGLKRGRSTERQEERNWERPLPFA